MMTLGAPCDSLQAGNKPNYCNAVRLTIERRCLKIISNTGGTRHRELATVGYILKLRERNSSDSVMVGSQVNFQDQESKIKDAGIMDDRPKDKR